MSDMPDRVGGVQYHLKGATTRAAAKIQSFFLHEVRNAPLDGGSLLNDRGARREDGRRLRNLHWTNHRNPHTRTNSTHNPHTRTKSTHNP